MRLVIVTGMSGSGKFTAQKLMEDMGFYCVDNLPVSMIIPFVELMESSENKKELVCLGVDVRADLPFEQVHDVIVKLRKKGIPPEILFMDAADSVIQNRYKESRRIHPLSINSSIEEGIKKEREILGQIREEADFVVDTSHLLVRDLKTELDRIFIKNENYDNLMVNIVSFGFKHGIPADADLVFDVRFLPNPFYIEELKSKTGNDKEVRDYVMSSPEAGAFLDKLTDMITFLIPNYIKEGKNQLVIAIGCTGGKHRSVTLANVLYENLKEKTGFGLSVLHRECQNKM